MNFKKLISWNFSVVEQGELLLIEANFTGGQLDFHQLCDGPIWGNDTEAILADIFANSKDIIKMFYKPAVSQFVRGKPSLLINKLAIIINYKQPYR